METGVRWVTGVCGLCWLQNSVMRYVAVIRCVQCWGGPLRETMEIVHSQGAAIADPGVPWVICRALLERERELPYRQKREN